MDVLALSLRTTLLPYLDNHVIKSNLVLPLTFFVLTTVNFVHKEERLCFATLNSLVIYDL